MQTEKSSSFDGRTLLAFVLMIAVWVIFTQFIMPKPRPAPETAAATSEEVAGAQAEPESGTRAPTTPGETPPRPAKESETWGSRQAPDGEAASMAAGPPAWRLPDMAGATEEPVVVETDLYRAQFSPRGARLLSWELKGYTDAQGARVDLVPADGPGALGLRLEGPAGVVDLDATLFALDEYPAERGVRVLHFRAEGTLERNAYAWDSEESQPTTGPRVTVERMFRIGDEPYEIGMEIRVGGIVNERQDHHLVLAWEEGIPNLETQRNLEQRGKAALAQLAEEFIRDGYGGGGIGCSCGGGKASKGGERAYEGMLRWAGVRGKYFTGLLIPEREQEVRFIVGSVPEFSQVGMRLIFPLDYSGRTHQIFRLYAGPLDYHRIKDLETRLGRRVTRAVDFGGKLIAPISKATHWFLTLVHGVVPNYGLVILILALVVRVVFHPLTIKSLQSQRKLQAIKPFLDEINAKYKDKPEERTKKTMELHKQYGINPLGGCLPLLVQLPVIYALYNVLYNAIELRKAPFVFWMQDLSAPDTVGAVLGVPINPLPLLMAATMFWQQKMTPTDPRQAPMMLLMPIMMVFFFYGLPSGLVLYWTVTNLLTIGQQMMMKPIVLPAVAVAADEEKPKRVRFKPKKQK